MLACFSLREAEVLLAQGLPIGEVCRKIAIAEQTYYRWRKEYGGMRVDQARRQKELEAENARLKKIVADLSLDNSILKETARGNFQARPRRAGPSMESCGTNSSKARFSILYSKLKWL